MNVAKDLLLKVKALFSEPIPAPLAAPVAPVAPTLAAPTVQNYKTKDGQDVAVTITDPSVTVEPSIGDMVTVGGMPAVAGDLELEDGTKLTIDENGAIANVTAIEPATQPDFVAPVVPTMEERLATIEAELNKLKTPAAPAAMSADDSAKIAGFSAQINKQSEVIKGLFELVEQLTKEPSADPKTLTGNKKEKFEKANAKEARLQNMADAMNKLKNGNKNPAAE